MAYTIDRFISAYRFLSNFYPCDIRWRGHQFTTTEHAYQWAKMRTDEGRDAVRFASSPGEAKRQSRRYPTLLNYEHNKMAVMEELLRLKFQDASLRRKLLATGDAELIEGNTWGDTYWGVCNGAGENHLGRMLMQIREDIRNVGNTSR